MAGFGKGIGRIAAMFADKEAAAETERLAAQQSWDRISGLPGAREKTGLKYSAAIGPELAGRQYAKDTAKFPGMAEYAADPLDMSFDARMARAREQGFDVDRRLYHGTNDYRTGYAGSGTFKPTAIDFPAFKSGQPVNLATDPDYASMMSAVTPDAATGLDPGARILPVFARNAKGVHPGHLRAAPEDIRSIFAAFDPTKKDSKDLLAQALLGAGVGAGGYAALGQDQADAAPIHLPPMKAFHGSPFKFDRFDIGKVGTGEGTQAFSHGLYFTNDEPLAKDFKDRLSSNMPYRWLQSGDPQKMAAGASFVFGPNAVTELKKYPGASAREAVSLIKRGIDLPEIPSGQMYEVETPEGKYLDWRTPDQNGVPGWAAYDDAVRQTGSPAAASSMLRDQGFNGVTYTPANMPDARNFSLFDDSKINLLRRYGVPIGAAAGGYAALGQDEADAAPWGKNLTREFRRVTLPSPFVGSVDAFINPTDRELSKLVASQRGLDNPSVRWGVDENGDVTAWDGAQSAYHGFVESPGSPFVKQGIIEHPLEVQSALASMKKAVRERRWDPNWFHGTSAPIEGDLRASGDFGGPQNLGPGLNVTRDPNAASMYAGFDPDAPENIMYGSQVMPLSMRGSYAPLDEFVDAFKSSGEGAEGMRGAHDILRGRGYEGIEDASRGDRLVFPGFENYVKSRFAPAAIGAAGALAAFGQDEAGAAPLGKEFKAASAMARDWRGVTPGPTFQQSPERQAEIDHVISAYDDWIKRFPPDDVRPGTKGSPGSFANFAASLGMTKNKAQGIVNRNWTAPELRASEPEFIPRLSPEKYAAISAKGKRDPYWSKGVFPAALTANPRQESYHPEPTRSSQLSDITDPALAFATMNPRMMYDSLQDLPQYPTKLANYWNARTADPSKIFGDIIEAVEPTGLYGMASDWLDQNKYNPEAVPAPNTEIARYKKQALMADALARKK